MTRRTGLTWGLVGLLFVAGCASLPQKKWGKGATTGALIGAGIGGGAGVVVANPGLDQDKPSQMARGGAIGAAAGLIIGGLIGHYFFDEDLVTPTPLPEPTPVPTPLEPSEVEPLGELVAVIDVNRFGFNQSEVPPAAHAELDALAAKLQQKPTEQLVLEGHTDNIGSESYNYGLGMRRAAAVRDYLAAHGVARERMAIRSKGKEVPIASNATPEGRAKNRRVEVRSLGAPRSEGDPAAPDRVAFVAVEPAAAADSARQPVDALGGKLPAATAEPAGPMALVPVVAADADDSATRVVYFPSAGDCDLDPRGIQVLDSVVDYLRAQPDASVSIVGHIDGVAETNGSTSSLRAERVRVYLIGRRIMPGRITTRTAGSSEPADTSGSDAGLAKNRRVELTIRSGSIAMR